jgi:hypothetical protein
MVGGSRPSGRELQYAFQAEVAELADALDSKASKATLHQTPEDAKNAVFSWVLVRLETCLVFDRNLRNSLFWSPFSH